MKHLNKILIAILLVVSTSCNEDEFLKEVPQDFLTTSNAYLTADQFESATTELYARLRGITHSRGGNGHEAYDQWSGTDIYKDGRYDPNSYTRFGNYSTSYSPTHPTVRYIWNNYYKMVANANTIITRLENADLTADQKASFDAEAKFFRAYAYRFLVYHFGDVPLLTAELTAPRTDFIRNAKTEVLNQMAQDFTDAANGLGGIDEVQDGKLNNLVAQHYLAETYIALNEWGKAITAASVVIDNPSTALMTDRFGSMASDTRGNPYWDLFRRGNQNRSGGNTEGLWVSQMEVDVPGGFLSSSNFGAFNLDRYHGSLTWTLVDPDGNPGTLGPRSTFNIGGRGINFLGITTYYEEEIWGADFDIDERSKNINLWRDYVYDNPESAYFGQSMWTSPTLLVPGNLFRLQYYLTKASSAGQHPSELYSNEETGQLKSTAGTTYRDDYYTRLAETYYLRAEAYLGNSEAGKAAADINTVRARSQASPVAPGDVNIDYILDERGRELSFESPRRLTLHRTDKLVERVRKYNLFNADDILDHHRLAPLPLSDIEANFGAVLEQNPGY